MDRTIKTTSTLVELGGALYRVTAELRGRRYDERPSKGRMYIWGEPSPEAVGLADRAPAPSRKGDDEALDAEWRRYNRAELKTLRAIADKAAEGLGVRVDRFSRKAGCSCGCSPGFVLEGAWNQDVFVHVENTLPVSRLEMVGG